METQLAKAVKNMKLDSGHWLYLYNNQEVYMKDLLSFVETGIQTGTHILLVDNDRNY
ncbi:hypothetical protein [Peribacillus sp. SCS-37]|uniref:hypothetical protein n=1 Tax=Paraperibacillus esterisolvens TaxID=3115296 RepID=UPI00390594DC